MKKLIALLATSIAVTAQAQLIDNFSDATLLEYTLSKVLDQNSGTNNISFSSPSGALQATSTGTSGAEQVLFLRSDFSLTVGNILRADVNYTLAGNQDLGIALATTATPIALGNNVAGDVRTNYILAAIRSTANHVIGTGLDGAGGHASFAIDPQEQGAGTTIGLYIARTSATTFDIGYDKGAGDVFLRTLTVTDTTIGNAVGFYADMRADGTIGTLDNLRITAIPEPSTFTLLGLGGLALIFRLRRRN